MVATFKTEGPCDGCGGLAGKLKGNSNGLVDERGRIGLWSIASMREPARTSGCGSAGGGSKAGAAGKSSSPLASSELGLTTEGATTNKTEGAQVCGTGAGSPV